jgi:Fe-Mn family superoxide dismutase
MHTLPQLPFAYDALEPFIDAKTMEIHHSKHHQAYVDNLNKLLDPHSNLQNLSIEELITNIQQVPEDIRQGVINNGGGHLNHTFFWEILSKESSKQPEGELMDLIVSTFESYDNFKKLFTEAAMKRFGSGWAWLVKDNGSLKIVSTANQDSPLMSGQRPILGIDVWEHAYYLKYQNRRAEYLESFWAILNWGRVTQEFKK